MILGILWFLCILRFLKRHLELRLVLGRPRSRAEQRIKSSSAAHLSFFLLEQDLEHIFYEWMIESAWAINKNRVNLMDCLVDVLQLAPGLQAIYSWCKNGTASCFLMFAWHTSRYRCIKLICLTLHSILVISWYQNTKAPLPGEYCSVRLKCEKFSHINFSLGGVPKFYTL